MANPNLPELPEEAEEALMKRILALTLTSTPEVKICEEFKFTRHRLRKIRNSDEFKALLKKSGDEAIQSAKEHFRSHMNDLAPLAVEALRDNLKNKRIEGVRLFAEIAGLKEKDVEKTDGNLTIVMPGASVPTTRDVASGVIEVTNE